MSEEEAIEILEPYVPDSDWEADIGYESGKCNKTPEEVADLIVEHYGEVLKKLADEEGS